MKEEILKPYVDKLLQVLSKHETWYKERITKENREKLLKGTFRTSLLKQASEDWPGSTRARRTKIETDLPLPRNSIENRKPIPRNMNQIWTEFIRNRSNQRD